MHAMRGTRVANLPPNMQQEAFINQMQDAGPEAAHNQIDCQQQMPGWAQSLELLKLSASPTPIKTSAEKRRLSRHIKVTLLRFLKSRNLLCHLY